VASHCSLLVIAFPKSFPRVFSNTIGRNTLGMLYAVLSGLRIITVLEVLKQSGQNPGVAQEFAVQTNNFIISLLAYSYLMCVHVTWSGPGTDQPEQPVNASQISSMLNEAHSLLGLGTRACPRHSGYVGHARAELNVKTGKYREV